jgi:DNA-directed RNA polymerase specialized sigma24 family protein
MASFLIRAAVGQFDINGSDDLKALLGRIARNKIFNLERKPEFKSPVFPLAQGGEAGFDPVAPGAGPASQIALKDLLETVRHRLAADELQVSDLRMMGLSWDEISERLGENAEALRKRLERALKRVGRELGIRELEDE